MSRKRSLGLAWVILALTAGIAEAAPQPGVGAIGEAAAVSGDLPRVKTSELRETTGGAAVLPVSNIGLINPGGVIDKLGDVAKCALDPLTGLPDDPSNLSTGPSQAVGCAAKEAAEPAAGAVKGAVSDAAGGIADEWTKSVLEGSSWLLRKVATAIDETTSPNLDAAWFRGAYTTMGAIALLLVVPLLFFSLASALWRRDPGQAVRSALVTLPMALVLSACALTLAQLGIVITDWACAAIASSVERPGGAFLAETSKAVAYDPLVGRPNGLPTFVALGAGVLAFICAVVVWIEFIIRDAAVYLTAFFLPLAFAGSVWPRTARASRRLVGMLAAVVFSKFVIVAVLSLAGRAAFAGVPEEGIEPLLAAIAMLLLAIAAPVALVGLVPLLDDDGGADHLRRGFGQVASRSPLPSPRDAVKAAARGQAQHGHGAGSLGAAGASGASGPACSWRCRPRAAEGVQPQLPGRRGRTGTRPVVVAVVMVGRRRTLSSASGTSRKDAAPPRRRSAQREPRDRRAAPRLIDLRPTRPRRLRDLLRPGNPGRSTPRRITNRSVRD